MKPYTDLNGKAGMKLFWNEKTNSKIKKVFKKSARKKYWQKNNFINN